MYIATVPNRSSPPAILLRESYRDGKKVKTKTLSNISHWPKEKIDSLRRVLQGDTLVSPEDVFEIKRSLPHGHVASVLGILRKFDIERLLDREVSRERSLTVAMIVSRIIEPRSKLATARGLTEDTAFSSLGEELDVALVNENELYRAMDWVLQSQERIENALAKRHLSGANTLVLYDVTSVYFEGRTCPLAKLGHNRDGKKDKLQIVVGLLTNIDGCPCAIEVFPGNTGDPKTLAAQVKKIKERFSIERVILVGDRGMITEARLREDIKGVEGLDWITALRSPAIAKLLKAGAIQMSFFDERDLAEITHPDYPGERLVVCRNPLLAEDRARKREELLAATERCLAKIQAATKRRNNPLRGKDQIALRVGRDIGRYKVQKHFEVKITTRSLRYNRKTEKIQAEAALDGFYVIRSSVHKDLLNAEKTVATYKRLSTVERAFRCLKTVDLKIRPIFHHVPDRVRSHAFICMLSLYVEWHMLQMLAPILFVDDDKETAEKQRDSIVAPAQRSPKAEEKAATKRTEDGFPVHSFQTLLKDLATLTKNYVQAKVPEAPAFIQYSTPTPLQQKAFDLLGVSVGKMKM
ncbi:MAG: IS1634 family transposase [candidate division NC10 bacterium]|nr:IS1634 family transposase [candidate division NC10 bacterium]